MPFGLSCLNLQRVAGQFGGISRFVKPNGCGTKGPERWETRGDAMVLENSAMHPP